MAKLEKQKNKNTESALLAATTERARAYDAVTEAERKFEAEQSAAAWQSVIAARGEHERTTMIHGFAQSAHDKFVAECAAAERAEQERVRLEALAKVEAEVEEILRATTDACTQLAKSYSAGWQLAIAAQGLGKGGMGSNPVADHAAAALRAALISHDIAPESLRIV